MSAVSTAAGPTAEAQPVTGQAGARLTGHRLPVVLVAVVAVAHGVGVAPEGPHHLAAGNGVGDAGPAVGGPAAQVVPAQRSAVLSAGRARPGPHRGRPLRPRPGALLRAGVLAEIGDDRTRFADARGLKAYAGSAPVTRASGKSVSVAARRVKNQRLARGRLYVGLLSDGPLRRSAGSLRPPT